MEYVMTDYNKLYLYAKDLSLLIVEDYQPLRANLEEILQNFFGTIEVASNGEDGLLRYQAYHQIHQKNFDIVLSDIQMPQMDGMELSRIIREKSSKQKLIILSAHTDVKYLLPLINLRISAFIPKPIDEDLLFDVLIKETQLLSMQEEKPKEIKQIWLNETYYWNIVQQQLIYNNNPLNRVQTLL